jgi:hypothetical protein
MFLDKDKSLLPEAKKSPGPESAERWLEEWYELGDRAWHEDFLNQVEFYAEEGYFMVDIDHRGMTLLSKLHKAGYLANALSPYEWDEEDLDYSGKHGFDMWEHYDRAEAELDKLTAEQQEDLYGGDIIAGDKWGNQYETAGEPSDFVQPPREEPRGRAPAKETAPKRARTLPPIPPRPLKPPLKRLIRASAEKTKSLSSSTPKSNSTTESKRDQTGSESPSNTEGTIGTTARSARRRKRNRKKVKSPGAASQPAPSAAPTGKSTATTGRSHC